MNENYNGNMHWNKGRSPVISAAVGISCITVFFILSADFPLWALLINPIRSENSLLFISDCRPFEGTQNKILPDLDLAGFSLQIIIISNSTNKVWLKKTDIGGQMKHKNLTYQKSWQGLTDLPLHHSKINVKS